MSWTMDQVGGLVELELWFCSCSTAVVLAREIDVSIVTAWENMTVWACMYVPVGDLVK